MSSFHLLFLLTQDELADIGSIYKVQVTGPHSELKQPWHLDLLHMKHTGTKEEMYLAFDCWFNPKEDKCMELPALYADWESLPGKLCPFFLLLGSGSVSGTPVHLFWAKKMVSGFPQEFDVKECDGFAHAFTTKEKSLV